MALLRADDELPCRLRKEISGWQVPPDALCCKLLGERPRGQDHREAVGLLEQVRFGDGTAAAQARRARDLARVLAIVLDLKTTRTMGPS